tara:strand:+ start:4344 stop:6893 length:2550 start_codon:yes stop_codon:yes gene_type:complete
MSQQCINQIINKAKELGRELKGKEAETIYQNLIKLRKNKNNIMNKSDDDLLIDEAVKIFANGKIVAARIKNNTLRNIRFRANIIQKIKDTGGNPYKAFRGILVGDAKNKNLSSIDARSRATIADLQNQLLIGLERKGLTQVAMKGALDREISMALHPKLGETKEILAQKLPKEAIEIAEVIRRVQKYTLKRKNRSGAYINELENYITRQSHDSALLRDAGFDKWYEDISPKLDEKTFADVLPRKDGKNMKVEFLRNVYNSLISGVHKKSDGEYTIDGLKDPVTAFKGPANLAKKLSQSRVLHFKDGEVAHEYFQKYNRRSLFETVVDGLIHDGRSMALMENLGTNPRAMVERILDDIDVMTEADTKLSQQRKTQRKRTLGEFSNLDNSVNAVGSSQSIFFGADFASVAAGFRMIQEMAKLGAATISSITDLVSKAAFISSNTERGFFHSFGRAIADSLEGLSGPQRKQFAIRLLVGTEAMTGNVLSRFGSDDFGPGFISRSHALFFKLNGMRYWNHAQKVGVARILAFDGAEAVGKSWNNVDSNFKQMLGKYGISEAELKLFKDVDMKAEDGNKYLFPDLVEDINDDVLDVYIRQKQGVLNITDDARLKARDELRTKIGAMYTDGADTAIPTPGAKERFIMNLGYQKGTVGGEAIRLLMQLKGFPITMITKGLTRQYYSSGFTGTMKMITGMTAMGYVAMSAKDLLRGKEPKELFSDDYMKSAKVLKMSMLQGGGMGIFGDYIFGEFNRYGQSFTQTLAGPTFGTADDLFTMYSKFVSGEKIAKDAVRFAVSNTPYANLFYTRAAMEYMFLHGMMEHLDPGYLRRVEKRLEKDYGQQYYFPPSRYAERF